MNMKKLSVGTDMVKKALNDGNWVVVDARDSNAFIGWRVNGEKKEGHIKGATDFSAKWLDCIDKKNLAEWLQKKMIFRKLSDEKEIIVYDYDGKDAPAVIEYFAKLGMTKLHYYCLQEWDGEMEYYPGYPDLVPASWVKELIDGKTPEHYTGKEFRLFEISWGKPGKAFLKAHIPGTVHIDSEEFEVGPEWIRVSDDKLEEFACRNGITVNTTVVIYGMESLHGGAAAKLAVVLKYMGVKQVCLLNGGMDAWVKAGYPTESGESSKKAVLGFGGKIPADPSAIVDIDEAKKMLTDPSLGQVIDIRPWKQYIGEDSGYDYVPKAGRLPGSIWCYDMYFYTNPDGTMENVDEMLATWKKFGVDTKKRMAFFCGSASWGGAMIEIYGRVAGISNTTMYEGGWCQWQLDDKNPYETGVVPELMERFPELTK